MVNFKDVTLNRRKKESPAAPEAARHAHIGKEIAIIGIGLELAQASTPDEFWRSLREGADCIGPLPESRVKDVEAMLAPLGIAKERAVYPEAAYLQEVDKFDSAFFRISPKEASLMDPNQRLFLETAWKAIEDAGYGGRQLIGSRTGVFVGYGSETDYKRWVGANDPELLSLALAGNTRPIIASRLSYLLDLHGPSMIVDTTCSSSLLAVHLACRSIREGECAMAIAGGVQLHLLPVRQTNIGVEAGNFRAKSFDESADGTGTGEGVAAVVLKPLEQALRDGDAVYAVIKGSATNHDGTSIGLTAPNAAAQEDVIVSAWKDAGVEADSITYIEAHGTGTKLGDPIEVEGMQRAFGRFTKRKRFCAIGSVKTNIGHLDNSAGIAGLIKAVLALRHKELPPSLHFREPNRKIDFVNSPVYVNDRLTPWEAGSTPRRCGVSSFGLSGTNCHVILEEAPEAGSASTAEKHQPAPEQLLTISARSVQGLRKLVEDYLNVVASDTDLCLGDMCYTANTGRAHYAHRAVLLFKTREELTAGLTRLTEHLYADAAKLDGPAIYYDSHQIVSVNQPNKKIGDITEHEAGFVTQLADKRLTAYAEKAGAEGDIFHEAASLYVEGANPDWSVLYTGMKLRRLHLPTYPFERVRCWLEPGAAAGASAVQAWQSAGSWEGTLAPLIDRRAAQSSDVDVYKKTFDSSQWILREHRIMNESVLVGTAYLEMVLEACAERFPGERLQFTDVVFQAPMIVKDGAQTEAVLVIRRSGEQYDFTVESRPSEAAGDQSVSQFTRHVQGRFQLLPYAAEPPVRYVVAELIERLQAGYMVPDLQRYNDTSVFEFGPRWNNLQGMYVGRTELLSAIRVPDAFAGELAEYTLYPSLMDNSLTTMPLIQQALAVDSVKDDSIFLPFSYGKLQVYGALPQQFYSYVRLRDTITPQSELIRYDISLLDESGRPIVEIEEYALKKARKKMLRPAQEARPSFYEMAWAAQPLQEEPSALREPVLVIGSRSERTERLLDTLRQHHEQVFHSDISLSAMSEPNAAAAAVAALATSKSIRHIIQADALAEQSEPQSYSGSSASVERLFALVQSLLQGQVKHTITLHLLTNCAYRVTGGENVLNPDYAAMAGLGKVIGSEYANLQCRIIDADSQTSVEHLVRELGSAPHPAGPVAYRNGVRYVEEFCDYKLPAQPSDTPRIQPGGTYVITGGAGGIGLEIAKHLAAACPVNLVLIGTTPVPAKELWADMLSAAESHERKLIRAIGAVLELEAAGSQVLWLSADVADRDSLSAALSAARAVFGRIHGVIHSAGRPGDGFLIKKDWTSFRSVFDPKAMGAWLLDELTREDRPDLFVMFSSNNTLLGMPGQSDYTAANSYLDAFAAYRNLRTSGTVTINWPAWQETGMAADHGTNKDNLLKTISNRQAIRAFDEIIHSTAERVIVGEMNMKGDIQGLTWAQVPINLSRKLRDQVLRVLQPAGGVKTKSVQQGTANAAPGAQTAHTPESIEAAVTAIWRDILGFEELNAYDNFFEIGGDSIMITRVHSRLDQSFPGLVTVADLFTYTSISSIAEYLSSLCSVQAEQEAAPGKEPMVGALDTAELASAIEELLEAFLSGKLDRDQAVSVFHKMGGVS